MIASILALSLAFMPPQSAPPTHDEAVTCTGVFLMVTMLAAQIAEETPSTENSDTFDRALQLMTVADTDRQAAAAREGIASEQSDELLSAWVERNLQDNSQTSDQDIDRCMTRYADAI